MLSFDFQNNRVVVKATDLLHKPFWDIWEADETPMKTVANKELTFIYLFSDHESACAGKENLERMKYCRANAFGSSDYVIPKAQKKRLLAGIKCYEENNESVATRALVSLDAKIDQLREVADNTTPEIARWADKAGQVHFSSNTEIIAKTYQQIETLMKTRDQLEARIKKQALGTKVRADAFLSPNEKGMLEEEDFDESLGGDRDEEEEEDPENDDDHDDENWPPKEGE